MNEVIEKTDALIKEIDNMDKVSKIKELNKIIKNDKELTKLIEKYKESGDENLKQQIIDNELFKEYKELEIDINLLIMEINSKLKSINNKGKCC